MTKLLCAVMSMAMIVSTTACGAEFMTAYETLKEFCLLQAESIRLQLDGKLSTVTSEQDESDRVEADIAISDMGIQNMNNKMDMPQTSRDK